MNAENFAKRNLLNNYIEERSKKDKKFASELRNYNEQFDIAVLVRNLRTNLGMSQRKLADKVGKPQSTIARIENGSMNTSTELLNQIAESTNQKLEIQFVPKK
ncbi:XRE family transcriptional regulator [Apilactobacillus micheneri]|uniref:helix-turn-helix domain-containing protein n=1 Tax=Apilactobacillus micheneri TaxID=1899430 RepID=UPI001128CBA8|nr:helix-turn-helix transcriptional regulator [Apilactobacillus micheneri]TPR41265.1 XRE family transcriptional regulator [Apilactobacillus micheneri]